MNIIVLAKQVPDLADELELDDSGADVARDELSWVTNEFDEHALEEALHLKEQTGGTVTVLALGTDAIDDTLYACLAKGADRAVKIGTFEGRIDSHAAARAFAGALGDMAFDLVLAGVQAIDDLDGQVGPLTAARLGLPHVSVVTHVAPSANGTSVTVNQEYAGGMLAELEVDLPAVLGIQAARELPRYAPVSRVRQLMKTTTLDTVDAEGGDGAGLHIRRLYPPEGGSHAEMIEGDTDEVVNRIAAILGERGLLK